MQELDEQFELTDNVLFGFYERFIAAHERIAVALAKIATVYEYDVKIRSGKAVAVPAKPAPQAAATQRTQDRPDAAGEKIAEGRVTQCKERGEWINAEVTQNNGRKVWVGTKDDNKSLPLITAFKTGQPVVVAYVEKRGKEKAGSPGEYYIERYVNRIEMLGTAGATALPPEYDDDPF